MAGRRVRVPPARALLPRSASCRLTATGHCRASTLQRGGSRYELGAEISNRARPQTSAIASLRQGQKTGSRYALTARSAPPQLKHWQASRFRSARECLVERGDVLFTERETS